MLCSVFHFFRKCNLSVHCQNSPFIFTSVIIQHLILSTIQQLNISTIQSFNHSIIQSFNHSIIQLLFIRSSKNHNKNSSCRFFWKPAAGKRPIE
ncbi:MAG TPA: hypothetical protein ENK14_08130 [Caldithrix sp.]|nr:hypothetical protein [Caldithrix sp.]